MRNSTRFAVIGYTVMAVSVIAAGLAAGRSQTGVIARPVHRVTRTDGAQIVTLTAQGGRFIFVWKSVDADSEASKLVIAGVQKTHPELLYALMSCVVPDGTQAIITSGGFVTEDIMIVSGEHAGCRGNVPIEYVK